MNLWRDLSSTLNGNILSKQRREIASRFPFLIPAILEITIYTDGASSPQQNVGAWAALLFISGKMITISGVESRVTHNAMELLAIIKSMDWLIENRIVFSRIVIVTDSQYAAKLPLRKEKLVAAAFITSKGNLLLNAALVKALFSYLDSYEVAFIKVKAHQAKTAAINYNREVDILVRKLLRRTIASEQ